ncbi:uncharacterized protein LOC101347675 [Trichechus manatus latirostris]|uniref:Uncharacterized protein LOC101347675 n=1 Tax=Trichechus manatus latirostris TaxID=127582 RepID=A0A2Y9DNN7_TRIMA|nr:uncharacterized protein LOC101347675 [Trichechus manatus latirostris]
MTIPSWLLKLLLMSDTRQHQRASNSNCNCRDCGIPSGASSSFQSALLVLSHPSPSLRAAAGPSLAPARTSSQPRTPGGLRGLRTRAERRRRSGGRGALTATASPRPGTARAASRGSFSSAAAQASPRPPSPKLQAGSREPSGTGSPGGRSSRMPRPGRRAAASKRMKSSVEGRSEKLLRAPKAQPGDDFTSAQDGESEPELMPDDFEEKPEREKKHTNFTLCNVCNIQLNSAAQAQIHYNGKSHQKRLKQLSNGMLKNDSGKLF